MRVLALLVVMIAGLSAWLDSPDRLPARAPGTGEVQVQKGCAHQDPVPLLDELGCVMFLERTGSTGSRQTREGRLGLAMPARRDWVMSDGMGWGERTGKRPAEGVPQTESVRLPLLI